MTDEVNHDKVIYVDMDDTICDFKTKAWEMLVANPAIKFPQSQYGFFTSLEPLPDAITCMNVLKNHFDVYILTRPSVRNPLCYTEKRVWVEQHMGLEWCEKLILCPNKSLMIGHYLIDDVPWPKFQGEQILFGQDPFTHWMKVFKYIMEKEITKHEMGDN